MACMFQRAYMFDSDLSKWDFSSVIDMFGMFHEAKTFIKNITQCNMFVLLNLCDFFQEG